jgi:hypothetical protein
VWGECKWGGESVRGGNEGGGEGGEHEWGGSVRVGRECVRGGGSASGGGESVRGGNEGGGGVRGSTSGGVRGGSTSRGGECE